MLRLAVKGFAAAEVTSEIMHRILADQPDICTVREDGRAQASAAPRWHLDRIDQVAIPLDREAWLVVVGCATLPALAGQLHKVATRRQRTEATP